MLKTSTQKKASQEGQKGKEEKILENSIFSKVYEPEGFCFVHTYIYMIWIESLVNHLSRLRLTRGDIVELSSSRKSFLILHVCVFKMFSAFIFLYTIEFFSAFATANSHSY